MNYTAIILAGGKSRRFGSDKTLLELNGRRIIDTLAEKCAGCFSEVIIAGSGHAFNIPGVKDVADIYPGAGPLGGIHAGLTAATNELCFVIACDMPNLHMPLAMTLLREAGKYDVVTPKTASGIEPLFAVYRRSILPQVEKLLARDIRSVKELYELVRVCCLELDYAEKRRPSDVFFNINYQEDYEMIKAAIPPVLSVVGYSDSGKTTYLEKLIPALKARGLRLGVVKHDAHSFDIDIPGKDSWRLTQAGADIMMISSPAKIAMIEKHEREESLAQLAERLAGKVDLVLTEGFKREKSLKIEIRRAEKSREREPFCDDGELFAIAGDYAPEKRSAVPWLPLGDAEPMADLIVKWLRGEI